MTSIRQAASKYEYGGEKDFRWRGGDISRVEGFTDAVFAFAVTLLVVSLEVPRTFTELLHTMRGFLAFGICFTMLIYLWHLHYIYFRRYGLEDTVTIALNAVLLFVVLFYIYPLKFLFTLVINSSMGIDVDVHLADGSVVSPLESDQGTTMMYVYNVGYIAVMGLYALLYWRAYRKREQLQLNEIEQFDTLASIQRLFVQGGVGILSILIVFFGGDNFSRFAGMSYFLIGPAMFVHGWMSGNKRGKLLKKSQSEKS
ncbi:MAG: DUF1211 domain-containing protein [Ignavibacteriae bacterium]|nr:DUF1211 domain-containing protein [Ignavibacteriota bacterium]